MIIDSYSMDVYCDNPNCLRNLGTVVEHDSFSGANKRDCDRQRKRCGWVKVNGKDICPECSTAHEKGE